MPTVPRTYSRAVRFGARYMIYLMLILQNRHEIKIKHEAHRRYTHSNSSEQVDYWATESNGAHIPGE